MKLFSDILIAISAISFCCLLIGLYKPWMMLWWLDTQNRIKVIKLYGSIALISGALGSLINVQGEF